MSRFACGFGPMLFVVAACSSSHGIDGERRDGGPDARRTRDADVVVFIDGPPFPWDGGGSCETTPVDLVCGTTALFAGRRNTIILALERDGCHCGEWVQCGTAFSADGTTLEITTELCRTVSVCDECHPYSIGTACDLPELSAGSHRVDVNGQYALDLEVFPEGTEPENAGGDCVRVAERDDDCGGTDPAPGVPGEMRMCLPTFSAPLARVPIRLTHVCLGCGELAGPCRVNVIDQSILVRPSLVQSRCDYDCAPDYCGPGLGETCYTPPLVPGEYTVWGPGSSEGTPLSVFWPDPPPMIEEVCSRVGG